jgi:hypothetical protein
LSFGESCAEHTLVLVKDLGVAAVAQAVEERGRAFDVSEE